MRRRRLPRRLWRIILPAGFIVFWSTTFHLQLAGTDAANPVARWTVVMAMTVVVFLTVVRALTGLGVSRQRRILPADGHAARVSPPASSQMSAAAPDRGTRCIGGGRRPHRSEHPLVGPSDAPHPGVRRGSV